jgi:hypothetical protein
LTCPRCTACTGLELGAILGLQQEHRGPGIALLAELGVDAAIAAVVAGALVEPAVGGAAQEALAGRAVLVAEVVAVALLAEVELAVAAARRGQLLAVGIARRQALADHRRVTLLAGLEVELAVSTHRGQLEQTADEGPGERHHQRREQPRGAVFGASHRRHYITVA